MFRFSAALLCAAATVLAADDLDSQMKRVLEAYAIVERDAADPVASEQAFYQGAIPGLLRTLDPHSVFFDPGQFEQLKKMESSTQKGFGSVVSLLPGRVIVLQTLPGTPSAKSGLSPGDEIVGINGYAVAALDLDQLQALLMRSRQGQAQLDVRRPGSARSMRFVLTPEELQSPSVERAFFIGAGIGYLRVSSFDENTAAQMREAIEKLGGYSLAGLVLDLRNNPGPNSLFDPEDSGHSMCLEYTIQNTGVTDNLKTTIYRVGCATVNHATGVTVIPIPLDADPFSLCQHRASRVTKVYEPGKNGGQQIPVRGLRDCVRPCI